MTDVEKEFEKVEKLQKQKYPFLGHCVRDGILFPGLYENSPLKLMIVLREPSYSWDENTQFSVGVDLNIQDVVYNLETHNLKELNKIWIKIAAVAYAIKNRLEYSEKLSWTQLKEGLSCVCLINLSKTPWKEKADTKDSFYHERVCDWESVVKKQLLSIDFDIILYGDTWSCSSINPINPNEIWDYRKMTDVQMYLHKTAGNKNIGVQLFRYDDSKQIIVNGYHPAYKNNACWETECIQDYLNISWIKQSDLVEGGKYD